MNTIQRKKKNCVRCGRPSYIWSIGMCQHCASMTKKQKCYSARHITGEVFSSEKEMFLHIWDNLDDKTCPISHANLNEFDGWYNSESKFKQSRFYSMFAHVLPKGKHPYLKMNPENILVVHPDVHILIDFGTEEQRKKSGYCFDIFYNKKEELKEKYEQNN